MWKIEIRDVCVYMYTKLWDSVHEYSNKNKIVC